VGIYHKRGLTAVWKKETCWEALAPGHRFDWLRGGAGGSSPPGAPAAAWTGRL